MPAVDHPNGRGLPHTPAASFPLPRAMAHIKVLSYTVHASKEQALRWARVARYLGCRSVSAWLEELADEQAKRVEELFPPAGRSA